MLASFAAAGVLVLGVVEVEALLREPRRVAEFEVFHCKTARVAEVEVFPYEPARVAVAPCL